MTTLPTATIHTDAPHESNMQTTPLPLTGQTHSTPHLPAGRKPNPGHDGLAVAIPLLALSVVAGIGARLTGCSVAAVETGEVVTPAVPTLRIVKLDESALQRLGVRAESAGREAPTVRLHVPGSLDYNYEKYAAVGPLVEGRVTSLLVKVGDRVRAGQTLGTLLAPALAQAQADFVTAVGNQRVAKEIAEREERLLAENLTTAAEASLARGNRIRGEAEFGAARARLQSLGIALHAEATDIDANGRLNIVSPIAGVIARRDAVLGAYMLPNESAFLVADLTELWANLDIYEADLPYLQVGTDVELTLDAYPGKTFTGKLALIEPAVGKSSRTVRARVVVPNADGLLKPGLYLQAAISIPESLARGTLLVASEAVQPLGDGDVVFVERGAGEYEVRNVRIGRRTAEIVEITSGLKRGEKIAVAGTFLLRGEVTRQ
jgi:membrane fusion protein, heavy metal efflux system